MQVRSAPLIGRRDELSAIAGALRQLASGRSSVLDISGEPGIGKSRLIAETCALAEEQRALVLSGRAAEFERDVPFSVFVDALDDYLGTLNARRIERLGPECTRELAQIFPSLGSFAAEEQVTTPERFRSHRAVRLMLDSLAAQSPLVLALDDLHWADEGSLELLAHLLRKRSRQPVLTLVAYRSGQAPRPLSSALALAARDGSCKRIEPGPLSREEATELVGSELDAVARDALFRDSGGNPFYLEQLARDSGRGSASDVPAARIAAPPGTVPAAVATALEHEVDALEDDARAVALAAAVAGEPFALTIVAAIAALDESATEHALDELLLADLVRSTEVPLRFRFRHPIVRHALYEHAGAAWRIGAHARAAAALAKSGASPSLLAHHVERSAEPGDKDAIELLTAAGRTSATRAPATAAHWFGAALRLLPDSQESAGRRLELLISRATALGAAGHFPAARDALDEVFALIPREQAAVRARLTALRAHIDNLRGDHGAAHALLRAALSEQDDDTSAVATDIKLALAADRFFAGDWDGMWGWAYPALIAAREQGDRTLHAAAAAHAAGAAYLTERLDECVALMDEGARVVDELPDHEVANRVEALHWLGWCEQFLDRFEVSLAHIERGIAVSRATGRGHLVTLLTAQSTALAAIGRLPDAYEAADVAVDAALLQDNDQFSSWALTSRSTAALLRGDVREAIDDGREAADLANNDPVSALAYCCYGEALIAGGEPDAGRTAIVTGLGGPEMTLMERPYRTRWCEPLVEAEIALGRFDAAADWVRTAEDAAASCPAIPTRQAEMLRARATLELARGNAQAALDDARSAIACAEAAGVPMDAARGRLLLGRALAALDEAPRATTELERARADLALMGALRFRDAAARELRRLGLRVPRARKVARGRASATAGALSPREIEVAELVRAGKTNRQIAAELFLSEKTIETHLSHVFSKLGVSSRAGVAVTMSEARERDGGAIST